MPKVFASEETWHVRFLLDMYKQRRSLCNGLICACIVAAGVLLTYPIAEMGFQDDWSYVRTALEFARQFELPIRLVYQSDDGRSTADDMTEALPHGGTVVNSGQFDGLPNSNSAALGTLASSQHASASNARS